MKVYVVKPPFHSSACTVQFCYSLSHLTFVYTDCSRVGERLKSDITYAVKHYFWIPRFLL